MERMEWLYRAVPVNLRLSEGRRRALWTWRHRQDQAFNMAVEMALAPGPDEPTPSRFTAWNQITEWRADETLPQHGVGLQRGGVAAGLEAVKKWREARRECERDAAYWTGRAQSDDAPHVLLRTARAERRLERHIAAGTKRLYRSLKRSSRRAGPALIVLEGARLEGGAIEPRAEQRRCACRSQTNRSRAPTAGSGPAPYRSSTSPTARAASRGVPAPDTAPTWRESSSARPHPGG